MSALVIGVASYIGPIGDILLSGGFQEIRWRDGVSADRLDLEGFRPDMVILIRDGMEQAGIDRLLRQALELDIPLFVW